MLTFHFSRFPFSVFTPLSSQKSYKISFLISSSPSNLNVKLTRSLRPCLSFPPLRIYWLLILSLGTHSLLDHQVSRVCLPWTSASGACQLGLSVPSPSVIFSPSLKLCQCWKKRLYDHEVGCITNIVVPASGGLSILVISLCPCL